MILNEFALKSPFKESDRIQDSSIFAVTERIELAAAVKIILGDRSVKGTHFLESTLIKQLFSFLWFYIFLSSNCFMCLLGHHCKNLSESTLWVNELRC